MYWVTNKYFWIPFYLILLIVVVKKFGRSTFLILFTIFLLILSSDQTARLVKKAFVRYRPCHNLIIQNQIHLIDGCGGQYGFISSHAINVFSLAMFMSLLFKNRLKYFSIFIFSWATIVSYSRIYAGVHYPLDIAGGALLGMFLGYIFSKIYFRFNQQNVK